jgi:hypothetical protein
MEYSLSVSESEESDPNKDSVLGLVLLQERGGVWRVDGIDIGALVEEESSNKDGSPGTGA